MTQELRADERDDFRRIAEAKRGAVQRDEAAAVGDVVEERFFLIGGDVVDVGVDEQGVKLPQMSGVDVGHRLGVGEFDAAIVEDRGELRARSAGR